MAIIRPTQAGIPGERNELVWEAQQTLAAASNGSAIIMPRGLNGASVTATTDGAQVSVETTTNKASDVEQELASVVWTIWDDGVVTVNTQDYVLPVTALRLVQGDAGATGIYIRFE